MYKIHNHQNLTFQCCFGHIFLPPILFVVCFIECCSTKSIYGGLYLNLSKTLKRSLLNGIKQFCLLLGGLFDFATHRIHSKDDGNKIFIGVP